MSIALVLLLAAVSVVSFLIVCVRTVGVRFTLKHSSVIDVVFTVLTCIGLAGSITGIGVGILAGLFMSAILTVWKASYSLSERATAGEGVLGGVRARMGRFASVAPAQKAEKHPMDDDWEPIGGWGVL